MASDATTISASSNDAEPAQDVARAFVRRLVEGPDLLYLFWPTILAYLRIVTHPTILPRPLTPLEAATNIERLLIRPHVHAPGESDGFWSLYVDSGGGATRGNAVPDTHLATLMRQNGVRVLYTRDRGFRRFDFLDVRDPFSHRVNEGAS